MLESLFGSINKERVLFFIYARSQGHAREMARFYECSLTPLQRQLEALERGGILLSSLVGRTRLYTFNPRYPLLSEVTTLIEKALTFYPEAKLDQQEINLSRFPTINANVTFLSSPDPAGCASLQKSARQ